MKRAEIWGGVVIAIFSIYAAWMSAQLPITWVRGRGPGAGTFPFYLSMIMLVCSIVIVIRALRGKIPEAWVDQPYFDKAEFKSVSLHAGSLIAAIASIYVIGTYGAIMGLILFHMRVMGRGRHSWLSTILLTILIPVGVFLFFEILMQQIMPKGLTEPLFNPIFELFNATPS
ncbi:MAG: tripartite tricarboxylate transporter TctB family protein [Gammaproteobacteria bacterium]